MKWIRSPLSRGRAPEAVERSDAIAIVTIHGTNDTATELDGEKWFQRGSSFAEQLRATLSRNGMAAEIVPFLWSGKNSAWERELAAGRLVEQLKDLSPRYGGVHLVGHSHGGNVATEAALKLGWGVREDALRSIDTLTTVGTPFFEVRHGYWQRLAAPVFAALMWPALVATVIVWAVLLSFAMISLIERDVSRIGFLVWLAAVSVAFGLLWFGVFLSRRNLARVRQSRTKAKGVFVFAIWHPNDEAISFLRNVESIDIEAFPPWALFRGARRNALPFAISIAVASLAVVPVIAALVYGLELVSNLSLYLRYGWMWDLSFPWAEVLMTELWVALAAPITFSAAYVLYLVIYGLIGGAAAELLFRGPLNRFITRVFRGIAYGRDSDQMIGNVSPTPHAFETKQLVISGELAERMRSQSEGAASALLEKYRWRLFSLSEDRETSMAAMVQDALTWDSLIHTTYFDQPEVTESISSHILSRAETPIRLTGTLSSSPEVTRA